MTRRGDMTETGTLQENLAEGSRELEPPALDGQMLLLFPREGHFLRFWKFYSVIPDVPYSMALSQTIVARSFPTCFFPS